MCNAGSTPGAVGVAIEMEFWLKMEVVPTVVHGGLEGVDLERWLWFWIRCFVSNKMYLIRMAADSEVIVMRHGGRFVD